ncbi:hypothetical protein F511_00152 [Dorcoceras hygrometricum]|nr:hypothetical protein F511_00152 [Dorcoceras hygrometricum]
MARPLPLIPTSKLHFLPASVSLFIVIAAVISVFSIVTFLCGSHRAEKKSVRLGGRKKPVIQRLQSRLSSKALLMAKMVSWRKVQDDHGEVEEKEEYGSGYGHDEDFEEDDEDVVWKKTIIKGGKCRPLDFSGKILYDSNGNLLPN